MNATIDISNVVLKTKRLILRPWVESDLNDFFEYASVDGVGQMASFMEFVLGNTNLLNTLNTIETNGLKTLINRALNRLKGVKNNAVNKARTLLENTLKTLSQNRNIEYNKSRQQVAFSKNSNKYKNENNNTIRSNILSRYNNYLSNNPNIKGGVFVSGEYVVLADNDNFDITIKEKFKITDYEREEIGYLVGLFNKGVEYSEKEFDKLLRQGFREIRNGEWINKTSNISTNEYRGREDTTSITQDDKQRNNRGVEERKIQHSLNDTYTLDSIESKDLQFSKKSNTTSNTSTNNDALTLNDGYSVAKKIIDKGKQIVKENFHFENVDINVNSNIILTDLKRGILNTINSKNSSKEKVINYIVSRVLGSTYTFDYANNVTERVVLKDIDKDGAIKKQIKCFI